MLGLSGMMRMARGTVGAEELAEVLSAAGIEIEIKTVKPSIDAFKPLATSASLPFSKLIDLQGKMKNGDRLHALLVITETGDSHHSEQNSVGVL